MPTSTTATSACNIAETNDSTMPRRAVITSEGDGWRLAPTQVNFAGGRIIASGQLPGFRLGRKTIRLRESDVHALLTPIPAAG